MVLYHEYSKFHICTFLPLWRNVQGFKNLSKKRCVMGQLISEDVWVDTKDVPIKICKKLTISYVIYTGTFFKSQFEISI